MRSKLMVVFLFIAFCGAMPLHGSEVHPLGIVIRPNLLKKVIDELNLRRAENRGIEFSLCIDNRYLSFTFSANWSDTKWVNLGPNRIYLQTTVSDFKANGKYTEGCRIDPISHEIVSTATPDQKTFEAIMEIQQGQFGFQFNPQTMLLEADRSVIANAASTLNLQIKEAPAVSEFLRSAGIREALLNQLLDLAQSAISTWLKTKLRGLSFVQSAGEVLKDNPIWKAGVLVENGAFTMELAERNPSQQFLTFAFNPFKKNSAFSTPSGLELYFNADFLNIDQLRKYSGLNPTAQNSATVLERTRDAIADPQQWSDADFVHPELAASPTDLSLVIPTNLLNDAWANFYRERLLALRTRVNIGKQTKGLVSSEEQDVHYLVTINPKSAPKMNFQANKFTLEVEDYVMDFSNWIEDRSIPTTQISSQISVGASLTVDTQRRIVKMVLDPNQFDLKLKDLKDRFTPDEMLLFQNMAVTIWKDFLKSYADFEIFPTLMDTGNLPIEIQRVSVTGSSVVLDLNVLLRGAKK